MKPNVQSINQNYILIKSKTIKVKEMYIAIVTVNVNKRNLVK